MSKSHLIYYHQELKAGDSIITLNEIIRYTLGRLQLHQSLREKFSNLEKKLSPKEKESLIEDVLKQSYIFEENEDCKNQNENNGIRDFYGHQFLAVACANSPSKYREFIFYELMLFKYRKNMRRQSFFVDQAKIQPVHVSNSYAWALRELEYCTKYIQNKPATGMVQRQQQQQQPGSSHKLLQFRVVTRDTLSFYMNSLDPSTNSPHDKFIVLPWQDISNLICPWTVAGQRHELPFIQAGEAYLPVQKCVYFLLDLYYERYLESKFTEFAARLRNVQTVNHIVFQFLSNAHEFALFPVVENFTNIAELLRVRNEMSCTDFNTYGYIDRKMLLEYNSRAFPPCMWNTLHEFRNKNRLPYRAKGIFGSFCQKIGVKPEDYVAFARECYLNGDMSPQDWMANHHYEFYRYYTKTSYAVPSCSTLAHLREPGGCAFNLPEADLISMIVQLCAEQEIDVTPEVVSQIIAYAASGMYRKACTLTLKLAFLQKARSPIQGQDQAQAQDQAQDQANGIILDEDPIYQKMHPLTYYREALKTMQQQQQQEASTME